ncbi:MAG TPA: MBL fold metallo-hydrolase [Bacteroidia bacterium]|nr:MBL fold metallo-hydrolase [Bacteroidia bacterium]
MLAAALFQSCARNIKQLVKAGIVPMDSVITLPPGGSTNHSLSIVYTGCGGMLIAAGKEALLTDPFYTGQRPVRLVTGIKIKPKNTGKVFGQLNTIVNTGSDIKAVLVAHSHYDHLQDLPYLLTHKLLPPDVQLIGSPSTSCTIKDFMLSETFTNADSFAYRQNEQGGAWINISDHLRVMPIVAAHAPHTRKRLFMKGNTCDKGFRSFKKPERRSSAFRWKAGPVYSFLIDVLTEDRKHTAFRIFLQSSACESPKGFPPVNDGKSIDLALLGVALSDNVNGYPNALLDKLKAKQVLFIHWEDFFRDLYHKKPKSLRLTNMKSFIAGLKTYFQVPRTEDLKKYILLPRPLTKLVVSY